MRFGVGFSTSKGILYDVYKNLGYIVEIIKRPDAEFRKIHGNYVEKF